jgi:chemotaxis signal transduction protein
MNNFHAKIDWDSIRSRMELSQLQQASAERARLNELLRSRAERLARRARNGGERGNLARFVICREENERFAFPLARVQQIFPRLPISRVPGKVEEILGVACINGELRAIADLRAIVSLPPRDTGAGYVLLLKADHRLLGLLVDVVDGIREIDTSRLAPADEATSDSVRQMAIGVTDGGALAIDATQLIEQVAARTRAGKSLTIG